MSIIEIEQTTDPALISSLQQHALTDSDDLQSHDGRFYYVAKLEGVTCGFFAFSEMSEDVAYLDLYGTLSRFKGRGIASHLLRRLELEAYKEGYKSIETYVLSDNYESLSRLLKSGYHIIEPEDRYAHSESAVYLRRLII